MEKDKQRKKDKVIDLVAEIKKRNQNDDNQNTNVNISARDNVIVGDNNNIYSSPPVVKNKVYVTPGNETISEEQKSNLQNLVAEIVDMEAITKRYPSSYPKVWKSLNRKMKVSSYHMIPIEKYSNAESYLRQWLGRVSSSKTALKKGGESLRKRRIQYIQINMKQLDVENTVRSYIYKNFDETSLKDLTAEELERTYRYVAGLKGRLNKK